MRHPGAGHHEADARGGDAAAAAAEAAVATREGFTRVSYDRRASATSNSRHPLRPKNFAFESDTLFPALENYTY